MNRSSRVIFKNSILTLITLLCLSSVASAQLYKSGEKFRMGMSFGFSPSFTTGSELENATLKNGIQSGFYYRPKWKKNVVYQFGVNVAFRGSRYKNKKDDNYNQLNLINLEVPAMFMFDLTKGKGENMIVAGFVPTYTIQSEVFIHPEQTARDEFRNIGLKTFDLAALLGYHINTYYVGLQLSAQVGLMNLNDGFYLPNIFPATGKGEPIKLMTFNLNIYF